MAKSPSDTAERFPKPYGKYELLGRLGDGGMAEVFLARQSGVAGFRKTVVIKRILPHLARKKRFVEMFVAEASLAAEVRHRNVVQVYELGQHDEELFMVMEYIQGTDLRVLLGKAAKQKLRLPPWFSVHVACEVLEALAYAWTLEDEYGNPRRIVHRDVTPSNIFISEQGDIKLGDFGVARDHTRESQTRVGQLKGKLAYMAPEQLYSKPPDHRVDVFAAGVVLWECLAQRRLFGGRPDIEIMQAISQGPRRNPSGYLTDVPKALDPIVISALEVDRETRIASATEFQTQLLEVLTEIRPRVRPSDVQEVVSEISDTYTGKLQTLQSVRGVAPAQAAPPTGTEAEEPSEPSISEEDISLNEEDELDLVASSLDHPIPIDDLASNEVPQAQTLQGLMSTASPSVASEPPVEDDLDIDLPPVEIDMEALVGDAVKAIEAIEAAQPKEQAPASNLFADLEIPELEETAQRNRPTRWSFIVEDEAYEGPFPFWIRDHDGLEFGPYSLEQTLKAAKVEMQSGLGSQAFVGPNPSQWMPMLNFLKLGGMEALGVDAPPQLPHNPKWQEPPKDHALGTVFMKLMKSRANGRLIVETLGAERFRTIEVVRGKPTYVGATGEALQIPQLLVSKKVLQEKNLPAILHGVVSKNQTLGKVLYETTAVDLRRYLPVLMKERLVSLFSEGFTRFSFDGGWKPMISEPFAPSLLAPLTELTLRYMPIDRINRRLNPVLSANLEQGKDFDRLLPSLGLKPEQQRIVERLVRGKRISKVLDGTNSPQNRLAKAISYILLDTELVKPI